MRVLVVEDDPQISAPFKRGLEAEGYAVDIASTGPDGLWYATEFPYDAVLLDVVLPGMSGIEVCQALRSKNRMMPILMLSARDSIADRVAGLDGGADDYLVKPFAFGELTARIRALIRRGSVQRPAELRVADLRLDPAARRAWCGQQELELTTKEFTLLHLFMSHPGVVLSRDRVYEHVWSQDRGRSSNVVDQHVMRLRAKIDRLTGVSHLETIRASGYRLLEYDTTAEASQPPSDQ
ncbi:MAG TPA: response regulator transcription factor [Pseudonocardiaceae bacterium]|jgi:two-component system OmpR family response regulator|nr:response regulator transcription factor [Pseudonocardiaceae bacterium]